MADAQLSLVVDCEFVHDIEVLDHDAELIERDLAIEVGITLHEDLFHFVLRTLDSEFVIEVDQQLLQFDFSVLLNV